MPRKARARAPLPHHEAAAGATVVSRSRTPGPAGAERRRLYDLQVQALTYFLENQRPHGLVLDRQRNLEPRRDEGLCSTAATGMGLIAVALASAAPYRLLTPSEAAARVQACLTTALHRLPAYRGMLPHFLDAQTLRPTGYDLISTIDSSWLLAGALWAAEFLAQPGLQSQAQELYRRADWLFWARSPADGEGRRLSHGRGWDGGWLPFSWDRLNGETAFMYLLAVGAEPDRALSPACWSRLEGAYGSAGGLCFPSADLGLFVWQYSLVLLDAADHVIPGPFDLWAEARTATLANYQSCRSAAEQFQTYRHFWGLSAGDGPPENGRDVYRCYSPHVLDGTAHLTATLASVGVRPDLVEANLRAAERWSDPRLRGRYGYGNVNVDHHWISRDVIGIDVGAAALALDNFLHDGRVHQTFHRLCPVSTALRKLHARRREDGSSSRRRAS